MLRERKPLGNLSEKEIEVKSQRQVESGNVFFDNVFLKQINKVPYETNTIDLLGSNQNRAFTYCWCYFPVIDYPASQPVLHYLWRECHDRSYSIRHHRRPIRQVSFENSERSLVRCGDHALSVILVALYNCIQSATRLVWQRLLRSCLSTGRGD